MSDLNSYLKQLACVGRKVGCFETSEKQTEITTETQQETLTGYCIKKEDLVFSDCLDALSEPQITDLLSEYLIDNNEINSHNLLMALRRSALKSFYNHTNSLIIEAAEEHETDLLREQGLKPEKCEQTGETIWK